MQIWICCKGTMAVFGFGDKINNTISKQKSGDNCHFCSGFNLKNCVYFDMLQSKILTTQFPYKISKLHFQKTLKRVLMCRKTPRRPLLELVIATIFLRNMR